jgi:hypothetical protein
MRVCIGDQGVAEIAWTTCAVWLESAGQDSNTATAGALTTDGVNKAPVRAAWRVLLTWVPGMGLDSAAPGRGAAW